MSFDASRRLVHDAASQQWGAHVANALMELLPPVDWDDFARRSDVENLRVELKGDIAELRGQFGELTGQFGELKGEVRALAERIDARDSRMVAKILAINVPTMLGVAGLVLAASKVA